MIEIEIDGTDSAGRTFLTWTPVRASIRLTELDGLTDPVNVTLSNSGTVGRVAFDTTRTDDGEGTLELALPIDGAPIEFWVAGEFQNPSNDYGDAVIDVSDTDTGNTISEVPLMVRVRKDANTLTDDERNRFLEALGTLNAAGTGAFRFFVEMHVQNTNREAHGESGFLPWHRVYLLDLERELQAIDSEVSLPYWRFDRAAPNLFSRQFMGVSNALDRVEFVDGHPLSNWTTNGSIGIRRGRGLARNGVANLRSEADTINIGGAPPNGEFGRNRFSGFRSMEGNPHGLAHTAFGTGYITGIGTAPRDPLFFLLHCNVDRLWAMWQWRNQLMSTSVSRAFRDGNRVGHRASDTMWPWNEVTGGDRPSTAPGGPLADSPLTPTPGGQPVVSEMLDYQGAAGAEQMYFAYDDVPFEI